MVVFLIVFPLVTLLAAVASIAGSTGSLRRNRFFGLRTPTTMSSDAAWQAGHRAAVVPSWVSFAITTLASLLAILLNYGGVSALPLAIALILIFTSTLSWILVSANRRQTLQS